MQIDNAALGATAAHLGLAGYYHLFFFGLLLPWAAVRSARKMAERPYPPLRRFLPMALLQQLFFFIISAAALYVEADRQFPWRELFGWPRRPVQSWLLGAGCLAALVALMRPYWRRSVARRERKVYLFMPRTAAQKRWWALVSLAAGVGEEFTYRGVMTLLLTRLTGSFWLAVLIAAGVFAISHIMQSWTSVGIIFAITLVFHALVFISGSLLVAMAVHFLYDLIAGLSYSHFGEKLGYPVEGIPPTENSESVAAMSSSS